jgi:hypothetical protein
MSEDEDVGGWMPLLRSVAGVWQAAEGSRLKGKDKEDQCKKTRMGERGSTNRIPSPFIHSRDVWETPCMVLGVHTPRT